MQSYNLGVSGGNQVIQGAVSLNYFNQDGIIIGSGFDRFSVRANIDLNVSEKFRLGTSLTVSRSAHRTEIKVRPAEEWSEAPRARRVFCRNTRSALLPMPRPRHLPPAAPKFS